MFASLSKYITAYITAKEDRGEDKMKTIEDNTLEENILNLT